MPSDKAYRQQRALEGRPVKDTRKRKGDRHKPGYKRPSDRERTKEPSKWERRIITAWDGEGANLNSGEHVYSLLANSKGDCIVDHSGLATEDIFSFFLTYGNERDINVIYGGSYDVNMILRDVPQETLERLWKTGKCYWKYYRIYWANRKKFTVQLMKNSRPIKSFVLWDVIGFFQSSFVQACEKWLGDLPVLQDIQTMKERRSTFRTEDINEIVEYNRKECVLLVMLMERLCESLDEAGIQLKRYDGAGSIAAALLLKYDIKKYMGKIPIQVNRWAQYAYSGGRIEAIRCGTTTRPTKIYRYDINSAYPSATLSLPSYSGARWQRTDSWDGSHNSLVSVKYHFRDEAPFYPLWYRDNHGGISYPREGYGIYWGAEIENLFKYYVEGQDFQIEWSLNCELGEQVRPFSFNTDVYRQRLVFADRGSMASISLKLGMNSEYGKLVQQAGYRDGRIPTYHQLLWGGQITAHTRALLFDAAMQRPEDVISFATDAIFTTAPLLLPTGKGLGQWTPDEFQGMTIVQAGVYFLDEDGTWAEKFRGFDRGSLSRDQIVEAWKDGSDYSATLTRFVGLGSALMSSDFAIWRTWRTDSRSLDIRPTGKRVAGRNTHYHSGLRATIAAPNITPDTISTPYPIVWIDGVKPSELALNEVDGVPLEVLVDEYEDGTL